MGWARERFYNKACRWVSAMGDGQVTVAVDRRL